MAAVVNIDIYVFVYKLTTKLYISPIVLLHVHACVLLVRQIGCTYIHSSIRTHIHTLQCTVECVH